MDEKKSKTNGVSESKKLEKALDLPTIGYLPQDRSSLLIEETDNINMDTEDIPKKVLIVKSLIEQETQDFINFLTEVKINFTWSYVDMPRLDPKLVVHNLDVCLDAKPIK